MPIRPENKDLYPKNWPEIVARVRERAGNKCEECEVRNHTIGYWHSSEKGDFIEGCPRNRSIKVIQIVCTTAHLDHNPENCDMSNLRFWCQRCHNRYDAPERAKGIKRRRREAVKDAGQGEMFERDGE